MNCMEGKNRKENEKVQDKEKEKKHKPCTARCYTSRPDVEYRRPLRRFCSLSRCCCNFSSSSSYNRVKSPRGRDIFPVSSRKLSVSNRPSGKSGGITRLSTSWISLFLSDRSFSVVPEREGEAFTSINQGRRLLSNRISNP